jgi:pyridinium-3,5-biscarboxylic acid mononucleotide synthase
MAQKKPVKKITNNSSSGTQDWLLNILEQLKSGKLTIAETLDRLSVLPYEEIGYAKIDHHRMLRKGFPEVIFGRGKTPEQIASIAERLISHSDRLLVTRASREAFESLNAAIRDADYNPVSRTIVVNHTQKSRAIPGVTVVCGGTADIPVAEEAVVTAEIMGNKVEKVYDIGVAGIHRLLDKVTLLRKSRVLVVVAGMEGALPSVIGGLVQAPIIAVPTSVGYGASFNGLAPLLAMLNSCAPGVSVVNIDNGFGAGYMAGLINMGLSGKG